MAKIADITFNDNTLTDSEGNLTAGALKRVSDATFIDSGLLQWSFGDRQNYLDYSEEPDGATWDVSGVSVAGPPDQTSPLGANTANRVTVTMFQGLLYLQEQVKANPATGSYGVLSAYVNISNTTVDYVWLQALGRDTTVHGFFFDLANGTLGNAANKVGNPLNPTITDEGDDWYRISFGFDYSDGAQAVNGYLYLAESDNAMGYDNSLSHIGETFDIAGFQMERLPSRNMIGEEVLADPTLDTVGEWSTGGDPDLVWAGAGSVTWNGAGAFVTTAGAGQFTVGEWYRIQWTVSTLTDGAMGVYTGAGAFTEAPTWFDMTAGTTYNVYAQCTADDNMGMYGDSTCDALVVTDISIKLIPNYAAILPSTYSGSTGGEAIDHADRLIAATNRIEDGKLLIEGEGKNDIPESEDFTTWSKSSCTISSTETSPTGEANATGIIANVGYTNHYLHESLTSFVPTEDVNYVYSCFLKAGTINGAANTTSILRVIRRNGETVDKFFTLSGAGSLGGGVRNNYSGIERLGSTDWYRCWVRFDMDSGADTIQVRIYPGNAFTGIGGEINLYCFGAQLEQGNEITSYMPTSGSPVIRTTEAGTSDGATTGYSWTMNSTITDALSALNASEGTFVALWTPRHITSAEAGFISVNNSSTGMIYETAGNEFTINDGTNEVATTDVNFVYNVPCVVVGTWKHSLDKAYIYVKEGDDWTTIKNTAAFLDDGFPTATKLIPAYGNELSMKFDRIIMYDKYKTQSEIEEEPWNPVLGSVFKSNILLTHMSRPTLI